MRAVFILVAFGGILRAQNVPSINLVANAEGENPIIAPNTFVEIKGSHLARANDARQWQSSDFVNNQMPTSLDNVSVTVNGKSAFVVYISSTQVNILTPPDALQGIVPVKLTFNGTSSQPFMVQAQPISPSFFVFNGGPYVVAEHADGSLIGSTSLYPGLTTPAAPGEVIEIYANGFGATTPPVVSGSNTQSGVLPTLPAITIGGIAASVQFAGLISPGLFQINVVVPPNMSSGDYALTATYNGVTAAPAALVTLASSAPPPTTETLYVAPRGNDYWSGTLPAPNAANTDGPFARFDHARAFLQTLVTAGLTRVSVQFRGGTYFLPATVMFAAADSGSSTMQIVYQNYSGESPVFSGGMQVKNWTNVSGNTWTATLPASTQYFENLFYNNVRRLRPRLGGYLGTYYRYVGPVYLNAPAPPAAPPDPACSVYFAGSGWYCYDRRQFRAVLRIQAARQLRGHRASDRLSHRRNSHRS